MNVLLGQGFEKIAFAWVNRGYKTARNFMKGVGALSSINPADKVQKGAKYLGEHVSIRNMFGHSNVQKSVGLGGGNHYRVTAGPQKGLHLIKHHLPNKQVKIFAHKDSFVPEMTSVKNTAKHLAFEGYPAAATQFQAQMGNTGVKGLVGAAVGMHGRTVGRIGKYFK